MAAQRELDISKRKIGPYSPYQESQPEDAQQGGWSRDKLQKMNAKFSDRMARALLAKNKADQTNK